MGRRGEVHCFPGTLLVWVLDGPGAFACLGWVHLPINPFFSQARLTGTLGLAPAAILTFMAHVPAFSWFHSQSAARKGSRAFASLQLSQ